MGRRKSVPASLGEELVPEVHGRDLWALEVKRVALGWLRFRFLLLEPETLAGHLEDMMDKAGALPTSPPAQQQQQDVIDRTLAA